MLRKLLSNPRFWLMVKICLTLFFGYYLHQRIADFDWDTVTDWFFTKKENHRTVWIYLIPVLVAINWFSDTWLWWIVVKSKTKVKFAAAFRINLISHAVGLVTPANIGEYGIKAMHFTEIGKSRQSFLLTFSYRSAKSYAKSLAGLLAGIYIWQDQPVLWQACLMILILLLISYPFVPRILDFVYHSKFGVFIFGDEDKEWHFRDRTFLKAFVPALIKFASYTGQLTILIYSNGILGFAESFWRSSAIYSLSSFIPTLSLFDPMVKTTIGDLVMVPAGVSIEWLAISIAIVWFLNLGLPSILGFFLWLTSKFRSQDKHVSPRESEY